MQLRRRKMTKRNFTNTSIHKVGQVVTVNRLIYQSRLANILSATITTLQLALRRIKPSVVRKVKHLTPVKIIVIVIACSRRCSHFLKC